MKLVKIAFVLSYCLLTITASAYQRFTINGHWWANLDQKEKRHAYMVYTAAFIEGAREGIAFEKFRASGKSLSRDEMLKDPFFVQIELEIRQKMAPSFGSEFDVNAVARIIDRFYKDPLNINISLYGAMLYSTNEYQGKDRKSQDDLLQNLRKDCLK